MVKYKSLLEKYCCNRVDGKETNNTVNISEPKENMSPEQKTEEKQYSEYIPSWRAPCDAWVTANVVDCTGINTPVFVLYNAYINDNPNDYMDIGQFGKVLRSRFPYRKRRRGKQGQQVYVYQDVALKNKDDSTQVCEDPKHPNSLQQIPVAGPSIVVGNNAGGRLMSSVQSVAEVSNSLSSSPGKRKQIESILLPSPSYKKLKKSANTEITDVPSGSAVQQNTDTNQHSNNELLDLAAGDESYTSTNVCRMAIGRRWIDGNLIDMLGVHTYAKDICQAYAQDHPDQPLNFTSLALLIRGKYPGRRRKVTVGSETRYLYQNLKLIRNQVKNSLSLEKELSSFSTETGYESTTHKTTGKQIPSSSSHVPALPVSTIPTTVTNLVSLEQELSSFTIDPAYESRTHKTTNRQIPSHSNHVAALPVSGIPMTVSNLPANSVIAYLPFMKYSRGQMDTSNATLVTDAVPSTSYAGAKKSDILVTQRNIPNLEDLLHENDKFQLLPKYQEFGGSDNKSKDDKLSLTNQGKQTIENDQRLSKNSQNSESMNVIDYLHHELSDINDMSKINYKVTIQVPSSKQVKMSESIPVFRKMSKIDLVKNYPLGFERHLMPPSDNESVSDNYSTGDRQQCSSLTSEKPLAYQKDTSVSYEMTNKNSLEQKQSWDYRIRKGVGLEPTASLVKNDTFYINKSKINNNRKGKMSKIIISKKSNNCQNESDIKNKSESLIDNPQGIMEKFCGTSMESDPQEENKECSTTNKFKGNGGSPTSTSPPCSAMNRLAEEIDISTPNVARSVQQTSACSSSTNVKEPTTNINFSNKVDPCVIEISRSILLSAKKTLSKPEEALNQALEERKLERAIIAKNPAVYYEESTEFDTSASNTDFFPCSVMPDLKELVLSSPDHVNDLLRHHQTCPGLGCSKECQTLRAAYVHIAIFHHRCQIWKAFSKIISKHSRPCRVVSCGVEFCHFVKHELHLNGVSVLPMQLLKERPTLEEEFKNCERIGTHEGDLHCRHMQCPKLPVIKALDKQLKSDNSNKEAQNVIMNSSSIFPDTPFGNALAVLVMKTYSLVRDLFRKSVEIT